jgi:hypothetical protein
MFDLCIHPSRFIFDLCMPPSRFMFDLCIHPSRFMFDLCIHPSRFMFDLCIPPSRFIFDLCMPPSRFIFDLCMPPSRFMFDLCMRRQGMPCLYKNLIFLLLKSLPNALPMPRRAGFAQLHCRLYPPKPFVELLLRHIIVPRYFANLSGHLHDSTPNHRL